MSPLMISDQEQPADVATSSDNGFWVKFNNERRRTSKSPRQVIDVAYVEDSNGCWNCSSHKPDGNGYPQISGGNGRPALLATVARRSDPSKVGLLTRHTCDNKMCIRPSHTLGGSRADNVKDAFSRNLMPRGERVYGAVLTEREAYGIYYSCLSLTELSEKYGVSIGAVCAIRHGRSWRWLTNAGRR